MSTQVKGVASLALLYAFRMLGLFMVLPVLVLYASEYEGARPFLLGLALGIYGLTQGVFQIPLGMMSDFVGRKPVIIGGLLLFAVGSGVAAVSDSIYGVIVGRAMQGAGAIASTIMALVADITSEENRTKAMAAIGISIGVSFSLAMIIGPALAAIGGLDLVFEVAAGLAVFGGVIVVWLVPSPPKTAAAHRDAGAIPSLLIKTAKTPQLLRLNFGIFVLHLVLMACFVAVPMLLQNSLALPGGQHWKVYLPILVLAFLVMYPFVMVAEKKKRVKSVMLSAITILSLSVFVLGRMSEHWFFVVGALFCFFVAFNLLEAILPSLVSKVAPAGAKGTAMGMYSTCQFLGAFIGGTVGGWLFQEYGTSALLMFCVAVTLVWFGVAFSMSQPKYLSSICIPVNNKPADDTVLSIPGVEEVLWVGEDSLLYLKVDKDVLDQSQLDFVIGKQ